MRKELLDTRNWIFYKPVTIHAIQKNEVLLDKKFPQTYKSLMKKFNAGYLSKLYMFKVKEYPYPLSVGNFCSLKGGGGFYSDVGKFYSEIEFYYVNTPDEFPKGLIIFAGDSNFICFDYREDPNTDNPSIVYWDFGVESGKNVYFVADSFDDFLEMLYSEEDNRVDEETDASSFLHNNRHFITGVLFDEGGFPIFNPFAVCTITLPLEVIRIQSRRTHYKIATQILDGLINNDSINANRFSPEQLSAIKNGFTKIPGFVWHHHQNIGCMQLVIDKIHKESKHTGGFHLWYERK